MKWSLPSILTRSWTAPLLFRREGAFLKATGVRCQSSRAGAQRKPSHLYGFVAVRSPVGDFGRNEWERLGIWLLRFPAFQTSSPLRDLLATEHNLDVIRCADWIIDLGPDGGDKGGEIVVVGTPETVAEHPTSHTGRYLKQVLEQHPPEVVAV